MVEALSALDVLKSGPKAGPAWQLGSPSLVVIHGGDTFLAGQVLVALRERLCPDEADRTWAWREFAGDQEPDPRDVFDEAATVPMFATATRAAVVRNADAFVSAARERLETLANASRGGRGLVILEVRAFPGNTRLAKAVATHGLAIDTAIPSRYDMAGWVRQWAQARHGVELAAPTAARLLERFAGDLGQIDQAIARLAAGCPPADRGKPIQPDAVDDFACSPHERTAWGMIDAAAGGDTKRALRELADLLDAGENPIGVAAQIASVLRRLSTAARLLALPPGGGRPAGVEQALREAGVAAWPKAMAQAKESLGQLGPRRARQLPVWLLDLDRALKGDASRGLRARLALERLFCKMSRRDEASRSTSPGARR